MSGRLKIGVIFEVAMPQDPERRKRVAQQMARSQLRLDHALRGLAIGDDIEVDEHHVADITRCFEDLAAVLRRARACKDGR